MRRAILAMAVIFGACRPNGSACPPPVASTTSATPPASTTSASAASVSVAAEPRVGTLTRSPATSIDVAAGADGRAYVAAIVQERGRGQARTMEWDVARSRVVEGTVRDIVLSDKQDLGNPSAVRVASAGGRAFVTIETEDGRTLTVVGLSGGRNGFGQARDASLAVSADHVVVAYSPIRYGVAEPSSLAIHVLDPTLRTEIAKTELPNVAVRGGQADRHQAIAILGGRLYVAHRDPRAGVRVTELELPTLRAVKHYDAPAREPTSGATNLELTTAGDRLFFLHAGRIVELGADLGVLHERELDTDDIAVGPSGALLTSTGLDAPGHRTDRVPAVGREASCTPAWVGDAPLLACALDLDASRIARLR